MERLWSPWRLDYVTGRAPDAGCVFCQPVLPPAPDSLVVHEGRTAYVILNLFPYNNGHLMVVPRRHVASLGALAADELQEVAALLQRVEAVLVEAYQPQGINVGINLGRPAGAGIVEHIHVHAVPRWTGDANFMTVVGETRVLPEDLASSARRLRAAFARV